MLMPIGSPKDGSFAQHKEIYDHLIRPAVESAGLGLVCLRADQIRKTGSIIREIVDEIAGADVVIADLTGNNPNVFYELGVRHALSGRSIMIAQDIATIPFDLRPYRVIQYDPTLSGADKFRKILVDYLDDIVSRPASEDNPVQEYIRGSDRHNLQQQIDKLREENRRLSAELSRLSALWPFPSDLPEESQLPALQEIGKLRRELADKVVVVDDDPGGMHTVENVPFYLSIDEDSLMREGAYCSRWPRSCAASPRGPGSLLPRAVIQDTW